MASESSTHEIEQERHARREAEALLESRTAELRQAGEAFQQMSSALGVRVAELEAERSLTLHLAQTDALTGLLNRGAFTSALIERLEDAHETETRVALFVLDLDRFKHLNDTLGHHAGDLLLNEIGMRLRAQAQPGDLVARLGGDEFALISATADVAGLAEQITAALAQPYWIYGRTVGRRRSDRHDFLQRLAPR
ncbi:MAG: GGDEF domain-containing protein, partial [Pseudomonadota bacterium]